MKYSLALASLALCLLAVSVSAQDNAPDYTEYEVVDVQELDLFAGPAGTAGHLSPDGTQLAHFSADEVCVFVPDGQAWIEDRCFPLDEHVFRGDREEIRWSPDSRYLTAPVFQRAMLYFTDTDLHIMDAGTGDVIALTEDGVQGGLLSDGANGNLDLAPVWLDADTLLFIRNAQAPASAAESALLGHYLPPAVYRLDLNADGTAGEVERIAGLALDDPLWSYVLAAHPESGRIAVNLDEKKDSGPFIATIWQGGLEDESLERLATLGEGSIRFLDYSADGEWLMAILPDPSEGRANVALVSTTTGDVVTPVLEGSGFAEPRLMIAGWAPTGDAFAYVVRDDGNPDASGLYIASAPGEPGRLVLPGEYAGSTCCMGMGIQWASSDVILIGRGAAPGLLLVQVGP